MEVQTPCHDEHDAKWTINTRGGSFLCLACVIKILEDQNCLVTHKRPALSILVKTLSSNPGEVAAVLSWDFRVLLHISVSLIGLLDVQDESFLNIAMEAVTSLVRCVKSGELVNCLLDAISQQCLSSCDYKKSLPLLSLVGKLLHTVPGLGRQLVQCYGSLLDYLCAALDHTDWSVSAAVSFALLPLYQQSDTHSTLPLQLSARLVRCLMNSLASSSNKHLHMNLLGLLKVMLNSGALCELIITPRDSDQVSLPAAMKKMLLTRHDVLQVAAVQCLITLLQSAKGQHCADLLIANDIAEFLFETLTSSNELLIGSVFCALNLITSSDAFFSKSHAVYGIEALMRSLDVSLSSMSPHVTAEGFRLTACILERHEGSIRLFSNTASVQKCVNLIEKALDHSHTEPGQQATEALIHIIKETHLSVPLPLSELQSCLRALLHRTSRRMHALTGKKRSLDQNAKNALIASKTVLNTLHIVHNTCRLLVSVLEDPLADGSHVFSAPSLINSQKPDSALPDSAPPGGLQGFSHWLMSVVDETCVPLAMREHEVTCEADIHSVLCSVLTNLYSLCPHQYTSLAAKLIHAGFITLTLSVMRKHSESAILQLSAWQCIASLATSVLKTQLTQDDDRHINSTQQSITQLHDKDLDDVMTGGFDDSLQTAYIDLVYVTYTMEQPLVDVGTLRDIIEALLYNESDLTHAMYKPPSLKHLVYMSAVCCTQTVQTMSEVCMDRLMSAVHTNCTSPVQWCTDHPALLHWIFSDPRLALIAGQQLLGFHMDRESSALEELAQCNDLCERHLVDILFSSDSKHVSDVKRILTRVINPADNTSSSSSSSSASDSFLSSYLPDSFFNQLLSEDKLPDENMCVVLDLMTLVQCTSLVQTALCEQDMKILYHLQKLLAEQSVFQENIMTFILAVMKRAVHSNDTRVCAMFLSCPDTLVLLERMLHKPDSASVWLILSHLLISHTCHATQTAGQVEVDEDAVINALELSSASSRLTECVWVFIAVLFWSALQDDNNTQCDPHNTQCDPHNAQCDPHNTQCDPHNTQCDPHNAQCNPHNKQRDPHNTQCFLHKALRDPRHSSDIFDDPSNSRVLRSGRKINAHVVKSRSYNNALKASSSKLTDEGTKPSLTTGVANVMNTTVIEIEKKTRFVVMRGQTSGGSVMSCAAVRHIFLLIQNNTLMEMPGVQHGSVLALWSILDFLKSHDNTLRSHLLNEPWNRMTMDVSYSSVSTPLPLFLIILTFQLLQARGTQCVTTQHKEEVMRNFLSSPDDLDSVTFTILSQTTCFIVKNSDDLDAELKDACLQKLAGAHKRQIGLSECIVSHLCNYPHAGGLQRQDVTNSD